jgi:hypothetical protein
MKPVSANIDLDELRATLEHTWLKRRLLFLLRTEREEWLKAVTTDPLPEVLDGIPAQIQQSRHLLASLLEGYSPAQLIDQGILSALPKEARRLIRDAVHRAYLNSNVMQPLLARLGAALNDLESTAAQIASVWGAGIGDEKLIGVLMNLESAAEQLRMALLELPEVVLP